MISKKTLHRWYDEGQENKAKVGLTLNLIYKQVNETFDEERLEEVYRELQGLLANYNKNE